MPAPNPLPVDEQFNDADWVELVANTHPGGGDSFTPRSAEACLVGNIPFHKRRGFLRYAFGWNTVDASTPALMRVVPKEHPGWPGLYCRGVSVIPFIPGVADADGNAVAVTTIRLDPLADATTPLRGYASYRQARVVCHFVPTEVELLDDDTLAQMGGGEENRWTSLTIEPRTDFLNFDGDDLIFCEGDSPPAGPKTTSVPTRVGQVLVKSDVQLRWERVPEKWLLVSGRPANILAALGKVNADEFFDYQPGELLCLGARLTRNIWHQALGDESYFEYDVDLLFSFFSPDAGAESPIAKGHNLQPFRSSASAALAVSGKWFLATYSGDPPASSGRPVLESTEFADIFAYAGG